MKRVEVASVRLWGRDVGAVAWNESRGLAEFEFEPAFLPLGLDIAPLMMPLRKGIFSFPGLSRETFNGLPGLLADALPDRFGNRLIDVWLARQGRSAADFSPVERLCYMGSRAMGALEFKPAIGPRSVSAQSIEIAELTRLAHEILNERTDWSVSLKGSREEALKTIIRVGTSAGGNRAKAVIAWNPLSGEVRSGQGDAPQGFEPWILKFDGVSDRSLGDPKGYGRLEYVYHRLARLAGISMMDCRLLEEGPRAHFMTRRFDRDDEGKVHVQSLCALAHYDFNAAGAHSYEQVFGVIQRLNLGYPAMEELYRRMVFNLLGRNQDDHTRNLAFLMDRRGQWRLSPAFDVIWAYNPQGRWTSQHQLSLAGKRDHFSRQDLMTIAGQFGIRSARVILDEVAEALSAWPRLAVESGVPPELQKAVWGSLRLELASSP